MKRAQTMIVAVVLTALAVHPVVAQDEGGLFTFNLGVGLGVNSFENADTGETDTYQLVAFRPDFGIGPVGLGLDLAVNYRFTGGENGDEFQVRAEDWIPSEDQNFLEIYLPKFRYVRYGQKGDEIFARFGRFSDVTFGNGFLMSNYSNELFLPDLRIFGGNFDIDGGLFGFPYVGLQTMVGNVASFDLIGARLYARPLLGLSIPVLPGLELGFTFVNDSNPYYYVEKDPDFTGTIDSDATASAWGIDMRLPVIGSPVFTMSVLGDYASQGSASGGSLGVGGSAIGFLGWGAQLRFIGDNFIPSYFNNAYDARRVERYAVYNGDATVDGYVGWLANTGFSLLSNAVAFSAVVSGPFGETEALPELRAQFSVQEGTVPGFEGLSVVAFYEKFNLESFGDLITAENAIIGAAVSIRSGSVVISLVYDVTYDPYAAAGEQWVVTSGLESSISF